MHYTMQGSGGLYEEKAIHQFVGAHLEKLCGGTLEQPPHNVGIH